MAYLIDGYNLLHAVGQLSPRSGPHALESARHWLLDRLTMAHGPDEEVTAVFDASRRPQGRRDHPDGPVRFEYARSADDRIEVLIESARDPRRLTVVSNDHRIQNAARRRGCAVLKCLDYVEQKLLGSPPPRPETPPDASSKPEADSPEDVRRWLEAFGDGGDDPLLKDPY